MSDEDDFNKFLADVNSGASLDSIIPQDLSGKGAIQHDEDAMDFDDIDELADEEDEDGETQASLKDDVDVDSELFGEDGLDGLGDFSLDDDFKGDVETLDLDAELERVGEQGVHEFPNDDDLLLSPKSLRKPSEDEENVDAGSSTDKREPEPEPEVPVQKGIAPDDDIRLSIYYPDFIPKVILHMNKLFGAKPSTYTTAPLAPSRPCLPTQLKLDVEPDQRIALRSNVTRPVRSSNIIMVEKQAKETDTEKTQSSRTISEDLEDLALLVEDWESLSQNKKDDSKGKRPLAEHPDDVKDQLVVSKKYKAKRSFRFDVDFDEPYGSDIESEILKKGNFTVHVSAEVPMNDPHLLFAEENYESLKRRARDSRYNISNDRAYDMLKENYQNKVRSTIGNLTIDHSLIAMRLQSPAYRVRLTKSQTRSWHRPRFNVKPGATMTFVPIKLRKKKKDKGRPITQLLAKTSDLTLGDNTALFLTEYSEEFPLVLSNLGMGSKLINYYRKTSPTDMNRPKLPLGETHVLDVQDRSAFWNFGFVEPGNTVPTLYNQMIRAPVFKHEVASTDFLLIRSTTRARGSRHMIRTIPYLFVAGQTFPVTVIPGPHSRKVTTASKSRLKMIAYRVLNKSPHQRLLVKEIKDHFYGQNDMQNRQRLKEFMEYQRSGDDQGYWKIRQGETLATEDTIRSMIQPEDIALLEAMQVGQQRLEDSGYNKTVDDDNLDGDGQSLEEQLAPWNLSRNFINAIQGKAMLQLHGYGDPTARGEGFSFLRTSMKGGFKAANESGDKSDKSKHGGHSYNVASQQKAYDEEIKRIWYAQAKSLQISEIKKLPAETPKISQNPNQNALDVVEGLDGFDSGNSQKVLKISRLTEDENGVKIRSVEIISDPNVIRAYLTRRRAYEDSLTAAHDIEITNDEDRNKRNKRILEEELARLRRNQDRRLARKATKGDVSGNAKIKSTTRKCATCGAVGHIKTNKSCPMYNDIYNGGQSSEPKAPVASIPTAFGN